MEDLVEPQREEEVAQVRELVRHRGGVRELVHLDLFPGPVRHETTRRKSARSSGSCIRSVLGGERGLRS